ncbi:MAG: hypothetical protein DME96_11135 [Verrucomicrobia bacterium]|nr:MAG: hypothetical protein DME96_11135 [Verrucomicrobiota bacterium]
MKLRHRYLVLATLGILLPYWQFVPWLFEHGLDLSLFFGELFANRVAGFFAMDVLVSAIVLIIFVQVEGRRLGIRGLWLPVVGTLLVGVSFGLPLFLYLRQIQLDRSSA